MKKKTLIDILLLIFITLEFSKGYMNPLYHEIFGIILIILLLIHLILNKNYLKNISKGKYNLSRTIMLTINTLFMLTFILSLLFGILSSEVFLKSFNIGSFTIIKLHKICAYMSIIIMGFHLGINFNAMFSKITKRIKNKSLLHITKLIIILYGIYSFIRLDILKHILGTYGFSIIEGNILINIFEYLSIVMMIVLVMNRIYNKIKKGDKNER